jgi:hypothetical protein
MSSDQTFTGLPITGALAKAIVSKFCQKPIEGDDTGAMMSLLVGEGCVAATNGQSAIMLGKAGTDLLSCTMRKSAMLEASRAAIYTQPVLLEDIERNLDLGGEVKRLDKAQSVIEDTLPGMELLAAVDPAILHAIGAVALAANAHEVRLYRKPDGSTEVLGFTFSYSCPDDFRNLFSTLDESVNVRGLFACRERKDKGESKLPKADAVEPIPPKAGQSIEDLARAMAPKAEALQLDPKFADAVRICWGAGCASVQLLKDRLQVGHARASVLMGQMEQTGFVGAADGTRARNLLIEDDGDAETIERWISETLGGAQ